MKKIDVKFILLPAIALVVGFSLTGWVSLLAFRNIAYQAEINVDNDILAIKAALSTKLNRDVFLMNGIKGLFAASQSVERNEFYAYLDQMNVSANYPAIAAVSFWQKVPKSEMTAFTRELSLDKSISPSGYVISPSPTTTAETLFPVKYIYPEKAEYLRFIGVSLNNDAVRQAAIELATVSGRSVISGLLPVNPKLIPGFIFVSPIYRNGALSNSAAERRANIYGVAVLSTYAENFFDLTNDLISIDWRDMSLTVKDQDASASSESGIFGTFGRKAAEDRASIKKSAILDVPGRTWQLEFEVSDSYKVSAAYLYLPWILAISGSFLTLIIAWALYLSGYAERRARLYADKQTSALRDSEEMFRAIVNTAKDAIVMMDDKARVILWNKGAENMFGFSEKEMMGKELHKIIPANAAHRTNTANLVKFGKTGESPVLNQSIELPVKKKNGEKITIELLIARTKIKDKWHAIGIMRDISERKKSEEAIIARSADLERLNKLMVGREIKMAELKEELARKGKKI